MIWMKNIKLSKSANKDKLSLILRSNYKRSVQFTNCPTWNKIFTLNGLELSHLRILVHQNHQISFHHSTLLFIDERLFVQYFLSFAWYFQKEDYLIFEFIDDLSSNDVIYPSRNKNFVSTNVCRPIIHHPNKLTYLN